MYSHTDRIRAETNSPYPYSQPAHHTRYHVHGSLLDSDSNLTLQVIFNFYKDL